VRFLPADGDVIFIAGVVPLLWLSAKSVFRPARMKAAKSMDDTSLEGPIRSGLASKAQRPPETEAQVRRVLRVRD
jgi:hypothetical protein